jgi:hypothetical protein
MGILDAAVMVVYVLVAVATAAAVASVPIYVAVGIVRAVRGVVARRPRPLAESRGATALELREQYADGVLSLVGLEERLEETLRARSHFELDGVLADLPARPRPRLPRVALFEAAAGVVVLLLSTAAFARAAGAALVLGAVAPPLRWRPLAAAFLAGLALLLAPLAAVPLGASAAWRFVTRGDWS